MKQKKLKNYSNKSKLFGALALISAQHLVEAQPTNRIVPLAGIEVLAGVNKNLRFESEPKNNKGLSLEFGILKATNNAGVGAMVSFPLDKEYLGTIVEQMRFDRPGINPHTIVEERTVNSYLKKQVAEGIISLERGNFAVFATGGIQYNRYIDVSRLDRYLEMIEGDGSISTSPRIIGREYDIEQTFVNPVFGLGVKARHKNFGAYIKGTTSIGAGNRMGASHRGAESNYKGDELFVSGGLFYRFNQKQK